MFPRGTRPASAIAAGLLIFLSTLWVPLLRWDLPGGGPSPSPGALPLDLVGVVHVHTRASDGAGTVDEIARRAGSLGIDFVWITDHNTLEARSGEGFYPCGGGRAVLALVDDEVSTPDGHFLALGLAEPLRAKGRDPRDLLREARARGAFAVLAHPAGPLVPWERWEGTEPDAAEIANGDSTWRLAVRHAPLRAALALGMAPWNLRLAAALLEAGANPAEERWDDLLRRGERVLAFAGADAHGKIDVEWGGHWGSLPVPGYGIALVGPHLHVALGAPLPGDVAGARRALTEALRQGRYFVADDSLAPPRGFRFSLVRGGTETLPGASLPFAEGVTAALSVVPPVGARVRLEILGAGGVVAAGEGPSLGAPIRSPGFFRARVRLRASSPWGPLDRVWIESNPVWVLPP